MRFIVFNVNIFAYCLLLLHDFQLKKLQAFLDMAHTVIKLKESNNSKVHDQVIWTFMHRNSIFVCAYVRACIVCEN